MKVLVVGDAHVQQGQNLTRFSYLGKMIQSIVPDQVIMIGDFLDLDSLSAWDKDKRKLMEGRRYAKEIDAGQRALDIFSKSYKGIRFSYLEGNHEERLNRYTEQHAELDGAISIQHDLKLTERGISFVPYKEHLTLEGVEFTHIPIAGNGRPISGNNICEKVLSLYNNSIVFGHTHLLRTACGYRHGSKHLQQVLNAGCFFEHHPHYIQGAPSNYWRGIVVLDIYQPGRFDIQTFSYGNMKRLFKS